jgi:hypothetical protein
MDTYYLRFRGPSTSRASRLRNTRRRTRTTGIHVPVFRPHQLILLFLITVKLRVLNSRILVQINCIQKWARTSPLLSSSTNIITIRWWALDPQQWWRTITWHRSIRWTSSLKVATILKTWDDQYSPALMQILSTSLAASTRILISLNRITNRSMKASTKWTPVSLTQVIRKVNPKAWITPQPSTSSPQLCLTKW